MRPTLLLAPLLLLVPLVLPGCSTEAPPPPPPAEVFVASPKVEKVRDWAEYTGRFAAVDAVEVRARVSGYLEKVHFSDGQRVEAGDLLFTIDPRPLQAVVAQRRASLQRAEADATLAAANARRVEKLRSSGSISVDQYEQRQIELLSAQAAVVEAKAALQQAELDLQFTEVRAPVAGRVSRTRITPGNLVSTGNDATLLTTLVTDDPLYFYFTLSEADAQRLLRSRIFSDGAEADRKVTLKLSDENVFSHEGLLDFIDNQIDPQSGTLELRARVRNEAKRFLPGQFGRVRLALSDWYEALLVPESALGFDQDSPYLLVVDANGKVQQRPVQLGSQHGKYRVVAKGVSRDDRVIVNGLQRARPGASVKVTAAAATDAATDAAAN
jgi:RND family efflux transporter MFP subunit